MNKFNKKTTEKLERLRVALNYWHEHKEFHESSNVIPCLYQAAITFWCSKNIIKCKNNTLSASTGSK